MQKKLSALLFAAALSSVSNHSSAASLEGVSNYLRMLKYAVELEDSDPEFARVVTPTSIFILGARGENPAGVELFTLRAYFKQTGKREGELAKALNEINRELWYLKLYISDDDDGVLERVEIAHDREDHEIATSLHKAMREFAEAQLTINKYTQAPAPASVNTPLAASDI
ncbi:MAG: YbjN domain-containing protein [Gammaproteobacteria bacterium]